MVGLLFQVQVDRKEVAEGLPVVDVQRGEILVLLKQEGFDEVEEVAEAILLEGDHLTVHNQVDALAQVERLVIESQDFVDLGDVVLLGLLEHIDVHVGLEGLKQQLQGGLVQVVLFAVLEFGEPGSGGKDGAVDAREDVFGGEHYYKPTYKVRIIFLLNLLFRL